MKPDDDAGEGARTAAGLSAELGNLLTVIVGHLDMMRRRLDLPEGEANEEMLERLRHHVEAAMQGARGAIDRMRKFDVFGQAAQNLAEVSANRTIVALVEPTRAAGGVEIETILAEDLWLALTDAAELEAALTSLIARAREAMPAGGRIVIETANIHFDDAYAALTADVSPGDHVMIAIADSSRGLSKDQIERLLDPLSAGEPGSLAAAFAFVRRSGGHLRIGSDLAVGTTVRLYLPRAAGEADTARLSLDDLPMAREGEAILFVEDDDGLRRLGVAALAELGYRILDAADGPAALDALDEAAGQRIDLLVTDVVLPGGLTGRAVADMIRLEYPGLPVVYLAGHNSFAVLAESGANVLAKPFSVAQLAARVRTAIDAASSSA